MLYLKIEKWPFLKKQPPQPKQRGKLFIWKKNKNPDWCGSVNSLLICKPKSHWFNSQSGHMPGFLARSPVGGVWEVTNGVSSSRGAKEVLCEPWGRDVLFWMVRIESIWALTPRIILNLNFLIKILKLERKYTVYSWDGKEPCVWNHGGVGGARPLGVSMQWGVLMQHPGVRRHLKGCTDGMAIWEISHCQKTHLNNDDSNN